MENLEARKKSDKILKRELIEELNEFPEIDLEEVEIKVSDSTVTLQGVVHSQYEKLCIEYYVLKNDQVDEVENLLEVTKPKEGTVDAALSGQDNLILKAPE